MTHDVFVSYAEEDKATANAVVATLEQHQIRCWVAPRDVTPGKDYAASLVRAINSSRVFVLVFSSSANTSPHVMREIERAASKSIPILPLRIEDVSYSESMEYFISGTHWLDALTPPLKQHLERLVRTVAALLGADDGIAGIDREGEAPVSAPTAEAAADAGMGKPPPSPQGVLEAAKRWGGRPTVRLALGAGAIAVVTIIILVALLSGGGEDSSVLVGGRTPVEGSPTATPLTGMIAFSSDRDGDFDIYVMNADGSSPVNITKDAADDAADDAFPAWSPDGSRIAFHSDRAGNTDIYVMNADGSEVIRLTTSPAADGVATWSPDGNRIAFESERDGNREIYVMNADGSAQIRLTSVPDNDSAPAWSPDGSRIAYHIEGDGEAVIYLINVDGSIEDVFEDPLRDASFDAFPAWSPDGSRIAFHSDRDGDAEIYVMNAGGDLETNLTNNEVFDGFPAWSPDGSRIAFESERDANREIYVMNADGSNLKRLTDNSANDVNPDWWSPEVQATDVVTPTATPLTAKIAFSSDRDGDAEIYVMNADGSDPVDITKNPANDTFPAWSPDGSRIAFVSDRDGDAEIYVMNADGSGQTRLTSDPRENSAPAWSPDGSRIVYHIEADGEADIYVMNADGSAEDRLTDDPAFDAFPAWSPDGSRIAFLSGRDGARHIWVMDADGSGKTKISNDPDGSDHEPAWSPDGTQIAFSRLGGWCNGLGVWLGIWGGSVGETVIMNADGSVQHGLTHAVQGACPAWSPDGSRIAFQSDRGESDRDGDFEIYTMYADDGEPLKQLTDNTANDVTPVWWSPKP